MQQVTNVSRCVIDIMGNDVKHTAHQLHEWPLIASPGDSYS